MIASKFWILARVSSVPTTVVDQVAHGFVAATDRPARQRVQWFFAHDLRGQLAFKSSLALRTVDVSDPKIALRVAKLWQRWQEVEQRQTNLNGPALNIRRNVQEFFDQIESSWSRTNRDLQRYFGWLDAPGQDSHCGSRSLPAPVDEELDPLAI